MLTQAVEQPGGNARAPHDSGPADAELRQPCFGCQIAAQLIENLLAHSAGQREIRFGHREGDVIAAAFMGGLNDQVHIDSRIGEGFKQSCGNTGLIGNVGEGDHSLSAHFLHPIHRTAEL